MTDNNPLSEVLRMSLLLNGSGCYKCPKIWCGYFADGFQRREDRNKHVGQHERPFHCSFEECLHAKLGFGLEKELKRHVKTSHLTGQSSEWAFPTKKPKKPLDIFSASAKGDLTTVERLVGEGVDIDETSKPKGSITAISLAVKHNHPDIVSYLIRQGCKDPGSDVFGMAIRSSSTSITIIRMLLDMKADPGAKKSRAQDLLYTAAKNGREEAIHLALTYDVDINKRTGNLPPYNTALNSAKANAHDSMVQILLENGARDERESTLDRKFNFNPFNLDPEDIEHDTSQQGQPQEQQQLQQEAQMIVQDQDNRTKNKLPTEYEQQLELLTAQNRRRLLMARAGYSFTGPSASSDIS